MKSYLEFLDVVKICQAWLKNPEGDQENKDMDELKSNLVIRPYLLLRQKEKVINETLYDISIADATGSNFTIALEISKKFNALFAYTNIGQVNQALKEPEIYDILQEAGLFDYIMQYCKNDYNEVIQAVNNAISFERIKDLLDCMKTMDSDSIKSFTDEIHRMQLEIDPEVIIAMGDIVKSEDPLLHTVSKEIENQAYNVVMGGKEDNKKNNVN